MIIKTNTKEDLKEAIINNILKYKDCVMELTQLHDESLPPVYIIISSISDTKISISIGTNDMTVGDIIDNDEDSITRSLNNHLFDHIQYNIHIKINITIKGDIDNHNVQLDKISFRDIKNNYMKDYDKIINSKPIELKKIKDASDLFIHFMRRDDCDKLIVTITTYIKDLEYTYTLNLVCSKVYVYNRSIIYIMSYRGNTPKNFPNIKDDTVLEFSPRRQYGKDSCQVEEFMRHFGMCCYRCKNVSHGKLKINAYSNVKLNY